MSQTRIKPTEQIQMPKESFLKSKKFKTGLISILASLGIISASYFLSVQLDDTSLRDLGIIFGLLVGIVPLTLLQLKEVQRKDNINKHLPLFLLALTSAVQSGANLMRAIEQTADRNMGALTPELKNLRANISWGIPIDDAFENFALRTGTKMARRVIVLLEMAMKIGGDISSNLEMIQKHVADLQNLEKERKSSLQPYTYTIYISFVVFLGIAVLLASQFFSEIETVQDLLAETPINPETQGGVFSAISAINIAELTTVLFNMSVIEAVFGGLAAGKIGSGSYVAGIKHVVVMVVISVIAFSII